MSSWICMCEYYLVCRWYFTTGSHIISSLQSLLNICESELDSIDLIINASKSNCIRIDPSWNCDVTNVKLASRNGASIEWSNHCRYLGIFVTSGQTFKCKFDAAKAKFYRSFNAIMSRAGVARLWRFSFHWCALNVLYYRSFSCQHAGDQIVRISNYLCLL